MKRGWMRILCALIIIGIWVPCAVLGDGVVEEPAYAPLTLAYWQLEGVAIVTPEASARRGFVAKADVQGASPLAGDENVTALQAVLEQTPTLTLEIERESTGAGISHAYMLEGLEAVFTYGGTLQLSAQATPSDERIYTTGIIAVNGRRIVRVSANGASGAKQQESVAFSLPAITGLGQKATIALIAQDDSGEIKASITWTFGSKGGPLPTPTPIPTAEPTPVPTPPPHFKQLEPEGAVPVFYTEGDVPGVYSLEDEQGNKVYRTFGSLDGARGAFVPCDETGAVAEDTVTPADLSRDAQVAAGELTLVETGEVEPTPTPEPTAVPTPEPTAVPTPEPTAVPTATPAPAPLTVFVPLDEVQPELGGYRVTYSSVPGVDGLYQIETVDGETLYRRVEMRPDGTALLLPADETGVVAPDAKPVDVSIDARLSQEGAQWMPTPSKTMRVSGTEPATIGEVPQAIVSTPGEQPVGNATAGEVPPAIISTPGEQPVGNATADEVLPAIVSTPGEQPVGNATADEVPSAIISTPGEQPEDDMTADEGQRVIVLTPETQWTEDSTPGEGRGAMLVPDSIKLTPVEGVDDLYSMETVDGKVYRMLVTNADGTQALLEADEQGTMLPDAQPLTLLDDHLAALTPAPTVEPTAIPTATPTLEPTAIPTATPTIEPTAIPTATPTVEPTAKPTQTPEAVAVMAQQTHQPTDAATQAASATDDAAAATDIPATGAPVDEATSAPAQPEQNANGFPWVITIVIVLALLAVIMFFALCKR